jgi:twinkle protein
MLPDKLAEHGIRLKGYGLGSVKTTCPQCSHGRRNKTDPCLSVTIDEDGVTWCCHHCGWKGGVSDRDDTPRPRRRARRCAPVKPQVEIGPLTPEALEHLAGRGISAETARAAGVGWGRRWFPEKQGEADCLIFPYRHPSGELVNAKFRTLDKAFTQVKDADKTLWLLDQVDIELGDAVVIVEPLGL